MSFKFSQKLIEEMIKCFCDENNLVISEIEAEEYLHSFADLFLAFSDEQPVPLSPEADGLLAENK